VEWGGIKDEARSAAGTDPAGVLASLERLVDVFEELEDMADRRRLLQQCLKRVIVRPEALEVHVAADPVILPPEEAVEGSGEGQKVCGKLHRKAPNRPQKGPENGRVWADFPAGVAPANGKCSGVRERRGAHVARGTDQPMNVGAWEHPWIRTLGQRQAGCARHVRLPAAAVLTPDGVDGGQARAVLLLPDPGTLPVASYRPALRGLTELRQMSSGDKPSEPLLIVGVAVGSGARLAAWNALLRQVARRAGEPPPRARAVACPRELVACGNHHRPHCDQVEQLFGVNGQSKAHSHGQGHLAWWRATRC
jgi:hypothetical protein